MTDRTDDMGELAALRPRETPDLIGHEAAEARFLSAWQSGRMPHSWLICGPRGIGKATFAFRAGRFALSESGEAGPAGLFGDAAPADSLQLDPENPVFRRVAAGAHADLMTLERSVNPDTNKLRTSISVQDVRKAGDFMRLTPSEGGWRVVVVDSVDELNVNAANALLKVLEEPPERALLLLVSHAPGRLLATIRSRCCRLNLKRLPDEQVSGLLAARRPDLSADDHMAIAGLADGSPGKALSLADEDGLGLYRALMGLMTHLPNPSIAAVHAFGDVLARNGAEEKFRTATELMAWWVGRLARSGARGQGEPAPIIPEEQGCGARLLSAAGVDRWLEVWEKINRLSDQTDRINLDRKQALLSIFHALQGAMKP